MKYLFLSLTSILLLSCSNDTTTEVNEDIAPEVCKYEFDETNTTVNWAAFKFNEKTAVKGVFNKINVLISEPSENMFNTLTGASFTIPVNSINSNNEERDKKIDAHFFGSMTSTEIISGLIKNINEKTALVEITMNSVSIDYSGDVLIDGDKISFSTAIDMGDFEAIHSIDSLNTIRYDLHKGTDGISKLWNEIEINVETTLKKVCD